jgi:tRNA dimethylallyltransferase
MKTYRAASLNPGKPHNCGVPKPLAIAIMGPTASGKSAVAEALAARLDARIINGDAFQVYRGFDIGTAKPINRGPYDLIDILDPRETYSAGRFVAKAEPLVRGYLNEGRNVIVCGGTGLYVRALWEGYDDMRSADPELRQSLKRDLNNLGMKAILDRERISDAELSHDQRSNPQRLLRFLEKRRMPIEPRSRTAWLSGQPKIAIDIGRERLVGRIEARIRRMVDDGWRDEVCGLLDQGVPTTAPAFRAIGYKFMADTILGEKTIEEATEQTFIATRQYAKRQMTWLRREPRVMWIDGSVESDAVADIVLNKLRGGS